MLLLGSALNDAPVNGETANYNLLKVNGLLDTLQATDAGRLASFDIVATAQLVVFEQMLREMQLVRQFGDNLVTAEQVLASKIKPILGSDVAVVLDLTPAFALRGAVVTDVAAVADAMVKEFRLTRVLTEVVSLVDQAIGQRVKPRLGGDVITIDDSGKFVGWDVLVDASVTVVDEILSSIFNGGGVAVRVASDAVIVTDGTARALLRQRTLLEAINLEEFGFGRSLEHYATFSEAIDLSDSFLANRLRRIVTADGVTLIDMLVSSASSVRTVSASDFLVVGDQALVSRLRGRFSQDSVGLTDAQLRAVSRLLHLAEGITFTDGELRVRFYDRRDSELLETYDQALAQVAYAVLYEVRIALGVATPEIDLGVYKPIALGLGGPDVVLGAYH